MDKEKIKNEILEIINKFRPCTVASTKENLDNFKNLMNENNIDINTLNFLEIEDNFKLDNTSDMILFLPTLSNKK